MAKEMLINVSQGEECRIALVENGRLEELYMERTSATSHVGNVYKGRVTNVEPSIQAAFVDFGLGRNGFLHISDLMPTYFGRRGEDVQETVGRKMARRDRPPIQKCLRRGDEIIVQIIKEGIGTKGPTLSTYISIPGRILVMMPGMAKLGVSRKIEDEEERRRLRQILDALKPPKDSGFIIRTAGVGKSKTEIQKDLNYLTRLWQNIEKKLNSGQGPMELYTEGDLVTRTVRDVFSSNIDRIVIDNKDVARRVKDFIKIAMPRTKNRVDLYEEPVPLFHHYGIEREIELMYSRHVPLPSGGSLVIDSTEAIVAIDVNSGKFRDHSDAETTAFKTDMEAADEIPRQLRLRDLGGVIICDFIDLRFERHRRDLEKRLHENLRNDRAKTKMLRMSQFGIIEMTRQRMRPSLKRSIYFDCPYCKGAGLVKTPESMGLDVMRRLAIAANDDRVARVELKVCPDVAFYLLNKKRTALAELESRSDKRISVHADASLGLDSVILELHDDRDGLVFLDELGMVPPSVADIRPQPQQDRRSRRGRQRDQRDHRDQRDQRRQPHRPEPIAAMAEDRESFELERAEDEVEQREEEILESAETLLIEPPRSGVSSRAMPAEGGSAEAGAEQPKSSRGRRRRGRRGRGRGRGAETQSAVASSQSAIEQPMDEALIDTVVPEEIDQDRLFEEENAGPLEPPAPVEEAPAEMPQEPAEAVAEIVAEPAVEEEQAPAEEKKRRRRPRGGRGRRKSGKAAQAAAESSEPAAVAEAAAVNTEALVAAKAPAPSARTGSADRHLMRDEPVLPPPVQRPRTYRDLDAIPDDFD